MRQNPVYQENCTEKYSLSCLENKYISCANKKGPCARAALGVRPCIPGRNQDLGCTAIQKFIQ